MNTNFKRTKHVYVGFEVIVAVSVATTVFWDVKQRILNGSYRIMCHHISQGRNMKHVQSVLKYPLRWL
jgi:hypothetical protein